MPYVSEIVGSQDQLASVLSAGVGSISQDQKVLFTKYVRLVLPLDGFVFWVKASLLSPSGAYNAAGFNAAPFGIFPQMIPGKTWEVAPIGDFIIGVNAIGAPPPMQAEQAWVQGSLHYATDTRQKEDQTVAVNRVVLTSLSEIQQLNDMEPNSIFIGEIDRIRFAFSQRKPLYDQAKLYHYVGDAIYPVMESQIIDDVRAFDARSLVVSNSLPIWLAMNALVPVYPAFRVPENLAPPYAVVHIPDDSPAALQMAPGHDLRSNHWQLVKDRVKVTLYGLRNTPAISYVDYILGESLARDTFGIMNMPVVRDETAMQTELNMVAMKKSVEFEINYYQRNVIDIAQRFIKSCVPDFVIGR